ncbi:hypothetical protein L6Q79_07790 [bacterium]|nr:hypothetical protein [bacterium]NUN45680.1 hypothetical protein [bacterium]
MTRWGLLMLVFVSASLFAQNDADAYRPMRYDARLTFVSEYTARQFASKEYVASRIHYMHNHGLYGFSVLVNMNQQLPFTIMPGTTTLVLPDSVKLVDRSQITNHAHTYVVDLPAALELRRRFARFEIAFGSQILVEKEEIVSTLVKELTSKVYYVDYEFASHRRSSLLGYGAMTSYWGPFAVTTGILPWRMIRMGNDSMHYALKNKLSGFLDVQYRYRSHSMTTRVGRDAWGGNVQLKYGALQVNNEYYRSLRPSDYQVWKLNLSYDLSGGFTLLAGYESTWYLAENFRSQNFRQWLNRHGDISSGKLTNQLPHKTVQIGLRYDLSGSRAADYVKMVNMKIFQTKVYTAKRAYYAYNPVGQMDVHNASDEHLSVVIHAEAGAWGEIFRSSSIDLAPHEIKSVPLFFYIPDQSVEQSGMVAQVKITGEVRGKHITLSSFPVTLYDIHSWDGDTWGLRYFIAPDEPEIQSFAKSNLLTIGTDSAYSDFHNKFHALKKFVTAVGKNLRYVSDPTTTFVNERVQYPSETLRQKSGDCEDLVAFMATNLMAIGHACAVVDIRPTLTENINIPTAKPGSIGHVFLLVDTSIPVNAVDQLGLSEFEYVARPDKTGRVTIWLPLETTVINGGFEHAHREGVRQYYDEVIQKNGVVHGTVHVYDF